MWLAQSSVAAVESAPPTPRRNTLQSCAVIKLPRRSKRRHDCHRTMEYDRNDPDHPSGHEMVSFRRQLQFTGTVSSKECSLSSRA